jgi:16S rRNA (uracil1498-N3)-methyltransferase
MHLRFHAPSLEPGDRLVLLPPEEAEHAARVMRVRPGAAVRVFNGRGFECGGLIEAVEREKVAVRLGDPVPGIPEPHVALTLAQAVLKGDSMDEVVRNAVMLGVGEIVPVVSAHVEADVRRLVKAGRVSRWRRLAVASAKQCGRAVVPLVREPVPFGSALEIEADLRILLGEPTLGFRPTRVDVLPGLPVPRSAVLAVGPEGGWETAEIEKAATAGWLVLTLGSRTLRADAVATATVPLLQFLWGDL